jgi:hypothetical protein
LQARLLQELQAVLAALARLEAVAEPASPAIWDAERMQEPLQTLVSRVHASDGEAVDLVGQLLAHASGTELEPLLRAVSEALDQFDFDEAAGLLSQGLQTQQAPL